MKLTHNEVHETMNFEEQEMEFNPQVQPINLPATLVAQLIYWPLNRDRIDKNFSFLENEKVRVDESSLVPFSFFTYLLRRHRKYHPTLLNNLYHICLHAYRL